MDIKNGRSIPDRDLDRIDEVWGGEIPGVREAVGRLRGLVLSDTKAMMLERAMARAVSVYTLGDGKVLDAEAARVLWKLVPCRDAGPYGIDVEWVDIAGAAELMGLSAAHVRRMIINEKIDLTMIRRPSTGNLAKKRWICVEDLPR